MDDGDYPVTGLVDAAVRGDERAWHEIVDRYSPLLASVIRGFRLTTAEAQDVAQTVWLRLVEHLGSLREPRALPMWIITTGKRECLRCVSDHRRVVPVDPRDPSWLAAPADEAEPDAALARAERHEALLAGLAELPARQRELLLLLMADPPLSYDAISQRTGIAHGGIGPTRSRALARLRKTAAVTHYLAGFASLPASPGSPPGREQDRAVER
ncbi:MAG TPA: sigma-70 family RNA polymerase sigma factor [Trebonia sp.]|nr:sigma-70 family RNA polymerase sigma factor [Trebonia sp.]